MLKNINIEISTNSIIKILIVIFGLVFLYLIKDVVAILFLVIILVSILEPIVNWFKKFGIPNVLSVIIVYLLLISILVSIVILLVPPIVEQSQQLVSNFPEYWSKITKDFSNLNRYLSQYGVYQSIESSFESFNFELPGTTGGLFSKLGSFVSSIISLFIVFVISFYLLVEENAIKRILRSLVPGKYLPYSYRLFNRMQDKLGLWLRAQLILGFIIFLAVYIALSILGVKYALILAIIAGLFEFIPYLGPVISGTLAVVLTLFQSPIQAILVLIFYIILQVLENNIFVPKIMQKTVGLNPVISILALLIGAKLGGIIGVILAIPVVTVLSVFVQDIFDKKKNDELKIEK